MEGVCAEPHSRASSNLRSSRVFASANSRVYVVFDLILDSSSQVNARMLTKTHINLNYQFAVHSS